MKECHICFKTCGKGALQINVRENRRDNHKWTMQEKLATQGTQDDGKPSKNTTQYVLDTTIRQQIQIT